MILRACVQKNRCLLLETASRYQCCQPGELAFFDETSVTIETALAEMLVAKRQKNLSAVYLDSLAYYLTRFVQGRERRALASVTTREIETFLADFKDANSRQTWLSRISTLFSFAERREYIAKNPCRRIESVVVEHKSPVILTVEQSRALLAACPAVFKPWLVLAMFAGVRPDGELLKVRWEDVNLETASVRILFPKVRKHKRIVPLEGIAVALLRGHPLRSGLVAPSRGALRGFKRRMAAVIGLAHWPADVLRHTAASYLLAKHGDVGKVANWLGNSPNILLNHYHEPVTKEACQAFWTL